MIGFIGSGNMGRAIIDGAISNNALLPSEIIIADISKDNLDVMNRLYRVAVTTDNKEAARADILFLAVKPNVLYNVIEEIKDVVSENTLVVSIAAGQSLMKIQQAFGRNVKLIRVMPNTPALVGEGMAAMSPNSMVSAEESERIRAIFESFGKAEIVSEKLMDAVTAVSGSSPAYVFMMIEAMADAAVIGGMPRSQAYTFAAQSVLGSAKMVLETHRHPGELKDMVCSPAGTTIDAVAALEENGFRHSIIDAMVKCMNKSKEIG